MATHGSAVPISTWGKDCTHTPVCMSLEVHGKGRFGIDLAHVIHPRLFSTEGFHGVGNRGLVCECYFASACTS